MDVARVAPSARVSRDDVRSALHTHFHAQGAKQQQLRGAARIGTGGGGTTTSSPLPSSRKRVFSFIRVQKKKLSLGGKRLFGGNASSSSSSSSSLSPSQSKSYFLCVTVQDGGGAQLHYLQLQTTFAVDVRQSWDIGKLHVIENNGLSSDKKRGAFALFFQDEDAPWQWFVDDSETAHAMDEFVWSLCALAIDQKKQPMPRLVRFNLEELNETAIHHNLPKRYAMDVDLLEHVAALKKKALSNGGDNDDDGDDNRHGDAKPTKRDAKSASQQQRLTSAENEDAAALLAGVNWNDDQLQAVEENLKKQLRGLEDDNITFLLSFEGDAHASKTASGKTTTTSVDRILVAIETLQKRVDHLQAWSNDSSELLEGTSQNMLQFESLNNQLEIHFKNSVALQETLATMMATIELPRECMAVLLRPVPIFPDDVASGSVGRASTFSEARGASQAESDVAQRDLPERLQLTIATIKRVDQAIKSTRVYPASEMAAFRARGDELARLSKTLCDKLAAAFDAFLQRRSKQWSSVSRQAAAAAAAASSSAMPRTSMATSGFQMRDIREISSSASHRYESRMSRTTTSFASEFESGGGKEMDWAFSNEQFHTSLLQYQPLLEALQSLDTRALTQMRLLYAKHASAVYSPHAQTLFRSLRDKLPKTSSSKHGGPHFTKPQALQSWSVHLSASSFDGLQLSAAPLLQQALDHLVPILTREQHFLSMVFFPLNSDQGEDASMDDSSNDELTLLMEGVFDKLLKRLNDFGEACATRNMLDALSLVVLVDPLLAKYQPQSAFLYNTLVSFQLQMKRLLIKFTDDHASWIQNHTHTDTRMAGVLSPISKTLTMVARLDECVGSKTDDATLALLFHRMVPATLQWLDKISETKPKYTALTRLENYLFIYDTLSAIIAPSSSLPLGESPESSRVSPLAQYAALAQQKYQENLQLYLASIWSYEFKQLVPLFDGIIELLKTVPVHEISFHTSRQEVRRILETVATGFDKSVKSMHDRMKKHFRETPKMLPLVWGQFVEFAGGRVTRYEQIATECYQLKFEPTPARAGELLHRFASLTTTNSTASMHAHSTHSSCG